MFIFTGQRRRGRTMLVALLAILIVGGSVAAWLWLRPATRPSLDTGREVAESFLAGIRAGHAGDAWESTTAEFKSAQGKESFTRAMAQAAVLKQPLDFISMQTVEINGQSRAEYLFRALSAPGGTVRLVIGREGGVWKVDRMVME